MSDSTPSRTRGKLPRKPRADFPLNVHKATGYWTKKVHGHCHYFGRVSDDPKGTAALEEWLRIKDDLLAGREPKPKSGDLTVEGLCNHFLQSKERAVQSGELQPASWREYWHVCRDILD